MLITDRIFEAFLHCETKAFLYLNGETGEGTEITEWRRRQKEEFNEKSRERFVSSLATEQWTIGTPSLTRLKQGRYQAVFDYEATSERIYSLVQLTKVGVRGKARFSYGPIRFISSHKAAASDKLMVAFDALALLRCWKKAPLVGQIARGHGQEIATFRLDTLLNQAKRLLTSITDRPRKDTPPPILKKHCPECEYQLRCRKLALEKDDLSLLGNFSEKERKKHHDKGVFTVTQLSYMFKPRRRSSKIKFDQALRALANRTDPQGLPIQLLPNALRARARMTSHERPFTNPNSS